MTNRLLIENLKEGKVYFNISHFELLEFKGKDCLDFLQRLTTNDCSKLKENNSIQTCLVDEKGRMIDMLYLFKYEDKIFSIVSPNSSERVRDWLNKFHITEEMTISNIESNYKIYLLPNNLNKYEFNLPTVNNHFHNYQIIISFGNKDCENILNENGLSKTDESIYNLFLIENGIPIYPTEINNNYTPLDINLKHAVSTTKGCYLGQEVLARLDTYDKIKFNLLKISSEFEMGNKIYFGNEEVGEITRIYKNNTMSLALAVIKNKYLKNELNFENQNPIKIEQIF